MQSKFLVTPQASHPVLRAVSRGLLGIAGILWVAMAASLCGCSPVNGWAMNQQGKSLYSQGQYQAARAEFERALMDHPYSADYAYNVAASMDQMGDHEAAEKMYRHALTLDPSHQPSYHGMAAMLVENGRTDEANDLISTWAATQPYSTDATVELGWLKGEMGDVEGANREFQKALQENPRNTRALKQMARANRKAGLPGEAAASYARALYMDPDLPEAKDELAQLEQQIYRDPALQMAATMPMYDPALQPSPFSAAVPAPQAMPQMAGMRGYPPNIVPMAAHGYAPGYPPVQTPVPAPGYVTGFAPGYTAGYQPGVPAGYNAGFSYGLRPVPNEYPVAGGVPGSYTPIGQGMTAPRATNVPPAPPSPPQFIRANWSQTQSQPQMGTSMPYSPGRSSNSFFQSQQSFQNEMQGEMMTSSPMPVPDSNFSASSDGYGQAPAWASEQMSSAPIAIPGTTTTVSSGMNGSLGTTTPATQISSAPVVPAF